MEKSYDKHRQSIKNQRHHFADKGPYSQSYGFFRSHIWMWDLDYIENWALKNRWLWTVVLEKTLESPLDCKETKLVSRKEISPEYSLEGLMLKLKLQSFGHLMQIADPLEKTLMLGKTEAGEGNERGWDGWMASPTRCTWVWASSGSWGRTGKPGVLQSMASHRVGDDWVTEQCSHTRIPTKLRGNQYAY